MTRVTNFDSTCFFLFLQSQKMADRHSIGVIIHDITGAWPAKKRRQRARTGRDVSRRLLRFNRLSRSLSITIQPLYYYFFPGWECLSRIMRSVKYCHADTSWPTRLETLSSPSLFVEHNAWTLKSVRRVCAVNEPLELKSTHMARQERTWPAGYDTRSSTTTDSFSEI